MRIFTRSLLAISLLISCLMQMATAQSLQQRVRGRVFDKTTGSPIVEASISIDNTPYAVKPNENGEFVVEAVPVGRHDISFRAKDYKPFTLPSISVESSRETVLEVGMEWMGYTTKAVEIEATKDRGTPVNDMTIVSALSFAPEETRRYAGGLDDPVRASANFAGATSINTFSNNSISVRGNSPRGMLYRIEGIDVPTPTHFAPLGSAGGTFTLFSINVLGNSDFYTGAFSPEYGNATGSVFDVHFRNGNDQKRLYSVQAGILGVDLAAEGPISAKSNASFLVNYRYSSLGLARLFINYLTVPTYQDVSFNIKLPTKKAGTFSVWGIGGLSNREKPVELLEDSTKKGGAPVYVKPLQFADSLAFSRKRLVFGSDMAAVGVTHSYLLSNNALWKTVVMVAGSRQRDNTYYNPVPDGSQEYTQDVNEYTRQMAAVHSFIKHRFSPRLSMKTGIMANATTHRVLTAHRPFNATAPMDTTSFASGSTLLLQAYTQWRYALTDKLTAQAGIHALHFSLNGNTSIEPRAGLQYAFNPQHTLSLGYGLHSRVEDFAVYKTRTDAGDNSKLDLLKAHHLVLGYYGKLFENHRLRLETYYQYLYNVPVVVSPTMSYSLLNAYELNDIPLLKSRGTGRNYGVDMGFERFTSNGLYYMLNASAWRSEYADTTHIWKPTQYDNRYNVRFLVGKEWKMGKKRGKANLLGANTTISMIGGNPYTPIDTARSRTAQDTRFNYALTNSIRPEGMWFVDWALTYTVNRPKYTSKWAIQIKNLPMHAPPMFREWDAAVGRVVEKKNTNFFPVISYKIDF